MLMKGGNVSNSWVIFLVAIILILMSCVVYLLFSAAQSTHGELRRVAAPVAAPSYVYPVGPGQALIPPIDVYNQPYAPPVKMDYVPPAFNQAVSMQNVALNYPPVRSQGIYDLRGAPEHLPTPMNPPTPMGLPPLTQNVSVGMAQVPYGMNTTVNYPTQGFGSTYSQLGILMRNGNAMNAPPLILPLMGRRIMNGRDKLQYFTISNTGVVNTKLPIRVKGKSCMTEYGCNELYSGDVVFVEGYNEEFIATIYENATFSYMPV